MFHLMIGLIGMGFVAAFIGIVLIPLWLGPLMQAVICIFARGSAVRGIPGILGILGTVASLYYFCIESQIFPVQAIFVYWVVYGLLLWSADRLAHKIKEKIRRKK